MKLSTKSLTITMALFCGGTVFFVAFLNFLSPPHSKAFLDLVARSIPDIRSWGASAA